MRIVVDLQAAQSPGSRHRGIGRYSMDLAKAIARNRGGHEVLLVLNGLYPGTVQPIREAFHGLIPPENIRVWHSPTPVTDVGGVSAYRIAAEQVREAFIAALEPDIVHVSSMFESGEHTVTGIGELVKLPTAVTLYDLIPLIYSDIYLDTPEADAAYRKKIEHLCRADLLLAISEASRLDGVKYLNLPEDRVVNISSAVDDSFTTEPVPQERQDALRAQFGLVRPFVMYTGGIDHRKNIDGLLRAWSLLPAAVRERHQLAVVCSVPPQARKKLDAIVQECALGPDEVVFTNFVSDADMRDLYRLCKLFVFPAWYEGFGLPLLEAMRCGAPVIGANTSSIPEVVGREDALFDPHSPDAIAAKILQFLEDDALRASMVQHGAVQATRFSWDHSARTAIAAFERYVQQRAAEAQAGATDAAAAAPPAGGRRPRLAYVSPMPPQRSGIADYSAELLPFLARHYDIDVVVSDDFLPPEGLAEGQQGATPEGYAIRDVASFLQHAGSYERVLYHFGNSAFHAHMFDLLRQVPGVVVLHDFFLSGPQSHRESVLKQPWAWAHALYDSHGYSAVQARFRSAEPVEIANRYPCNFDVLTDAMGVIVHSAVSLRMAAAWYGPRCARDWQVIPLLRVPVAQVDRAAARARLGVADDEFLVCSYGLLGPTKHNQRLFDAWTQSALAQDPRCRLVFVGQNQDSPYGHAVASSVAGHAGPSRVEISGWTDTATFRDWLAAADVAVQLRTMSRGETSAAVGDCMNHGLPVIVNANGSMADLPQDAVWILPDEFADQELVDALQALWRNPERRAAMGAHGQHIIRTERAPDRCAGQYAQAIEHFYAAARRGVDGLVRALAHTLPADTSEHYRLLLAAAVDANYPRPAPARRLFIDVGSYADTMDATLAIGRPLPPLVRTLLEGMPDGWRVEPVYFDMQYNRYRCARRHALHALGCPPEALDDGVAEPRLDDLWCVLLSGEDAGDEVALLASAQRPPLGRECIGPLLLREGGADGDLLRAVLDTALPARGSVSGRQLFVDISELVQRDAGSGIQRVVKNLLQEFLAHAPAGMQVRPVWAVRDMPGYFNADKYLLGLAGLTWPEGSLLDERIVFHPGDMFLGLDLQPFVVPAQASFLAELRRTGVKVGFVVYDLLPITHPECFYPDAPEGHTRWLAEVVQGDAVYCISQAVQDTLAHWLQQHPTIRRAATPLALHHFHLGADIAPDAAVPEVPLASARILLRQLERYPTFLMVGTVEPRKGHAQMLAAFEELWAQGIGANLLIVGKQGWMVEALAERMRNHPERERRLIWLENCSDEVLMQLYSGSACLIAASLDEGFGLPLIEAAQRGTPILARDIPVFREVAGEHASYFSGTEPQEAAAALRAWLALWAQGRQVPSTGMPWLTWKQSAGQLGRLLG